MFMLQFWLINVLQTSSNSLKRKYRFSDSKLKRDASGEKITHDGDPVLVGCIKSLWWPCSSRMHEISKCLIHEDFVCMKSLSVLSYSWRFLCMKSLSVLSYSWRFCKAWLSSFSEKLSAPMSIISKGGEDDFLINLPLSVWDQRRMQC